MREHSLSLNPNGSFLIIIFKEFWLLLSQILLAYDQLGLELFRVSKSKIHGKKLKNIKIGISSDLCIEGIIKSSESIPSTFKLANEGIEEKGEVNDF